MQFIEAAFMAGIVVLNLIFCLIMGSSSPYLWKYGFWAIAFFTLVTITCLLCGRVIWDNISAGFMNSGQDVAPNSWNVMKKSFIFLLIIFFIIITEQSFTTWLPTYSKAIFNAGPLLATQTTVIFAFAALTGRILYGFLILKRSWSSLFTGLLVFILVIVSTLSIVLIAQTPHPVFLYLIPCIGFL